MPAAKACSRAKDTYRCDRLLAASLPSGPEALYRIDSVPVNGQSYIRDHRVAGKIIYPAAAYSMAGIAVYHALRSSGCKSRSIALTNLKFRQPLSLTRHDSTNLRLSYKPVEDEFSVHSPHGDGSGPLTLHATGRLARTDAASTPRSVQINELLMRCDEFLDVADFYQRLRRSGLEYGPYFQRIDYLRASRATGEAVAQLVAHPDLSANQDPWARSVTLLDSAFQSLAATMDVDGSELYVPMRIAALHVHAEFAADMWCYARQIKSNSRTVRGDISLFDGSGRPVVEIRGLQCLRKPVNRAAETTRPVVTVDEKSSGHNSCFQ